jgi:hypothetical protein
MLNCECGDSGNGKSDPCSDDRGRRTDDILLRWRRNADIECGSAGRRVSMEPGRSRNASNSSDNGRKL